jgi:hypothetical protein
MTKIRGKPKTISDSDGFVLCSELPEDLAKGDVVRLANGTTQLVLDDGTHFAHGNRGSEFIITISYSYYPDTGECYGSKYFSVKTCKHIFEEMPDIVAYKRVVSK